MRSVSLRGKILKELEKKPRSLKELKAKLGNDKKVAKLVEELEGQKKIGRWKGLYALRPAKGAAAVPCKLVKLGKSFGFAKPDDDSGDICWGPCPATAYWWSWKRAPAWPIPARAG